MKIKPLGVGVLAIAAAGAVYGGYRVYRNAVPAAPPRPDLIVGIVTWPGYAGGIVANNGFKPNKDSIYFSRYGLNVEFKLMEDVDARAKAFANGSVDVVWSTVDFWANELPGFLKGGVKARAIMQVDWSQGGDAIVADNSIQKIEDLKGKKISLTLQTPSQWLLEYGISHSGLTDADQAQIVKGLVGKNASPDARDDFIAKRVDAAVVWEPDVSDAIKKRANSHRLFTSATANHIIADLMVAREDFIKEHPDRIEKFIRGWFDGTEQANKQPDTVARLLMENEPVYQTVGAAETRSELGTVKWATLQDNAEMFGLDSKTAPRFDSIFSDAGKAWVNRGIIQATVAAGVAKDTQFLQKIYNENPPPPIEVKVPPAPPGLCNRVGTMTPQLTVNFKSGSSELTAGGKKTVEDNLANLPRQVSNAYYCVEGNTDSQGDHDKNVVLSGERAQSIREELVNRYKIPAAQLIAVGHGPDNPLCEEKTPACLARNRRTDVKVISMESVSR